MTHTVHHVMMWRNGMTILAHQFTLDHLSYVIVYGMTVPPSFPSQPGVDQESGQLDSWPARPIKPASSFPPRNASTAPHPSVHRSRSAKIPDRMPVAPKPKFLEQLEAYLHREMKLLECPPDGPHELRLQASHSPSPPYPPYPHSRSYLIGASRSVPIPHRRLQNLQATFVGHQK